MSEGEINELSRTIGKLEAQLTSVQNELAEVRKQFDGLWKKLDRMSDQLTGNRIKVAGLAASVSISMIALGYALKRIFGAH